MLFRELIAGTIGEHRIGLVDLAKSEVTTIDTFVMRFNSFGHAVDRGVYSKLVAYTPVSNCWVYVRPNRAHTDMVVRFDGAGKPPTAKMYANGRIGHLLISPSHAQIGAIVMPDRFGSGKVPTRSQIQTWDQDGGEPSSVSPVFHGRIVSASFLSGPKIGLAVGRTGDSSDAPGTGSLFSGVGIFDASTSNFTPLISHEAASVGSGTGLLFSADCAFSPDGHVAIVDNRLPQVAILTGHQERNILWRPLRPDQNVRISQIKFSPSSDHLLIACRAPSDPPEQWRDRWLTAIPLSKNAATFHASPSSFRN